MVKHKKLIICFLKIHPKLNSTNNDSKDGPKKTEDKISFWQCKCGITIYFVIQVNLTDFYLRQCKMQYLFPAQALYRLIEITVKITEK